MHVAPKVLHETPRLPVDEIQLLDAGIYQAARGEHYPAHRHKALELIVYQEGMIDLLVDTLPNPIVSGPAPGSAKHSSAELFAVRTRPGTALLIPAGCIHADRALTPYTQVYLQLNYPQLEHRYPTPYTLFEDTDRSVEKLAVTLMHEWNGRAAYRERMVRVLLEQLNIMLYRAGSEPHLSEAEKLVRRAETFLEAYETANLSVQELAEELGVAPSTLRGYFARLPPPVAQGLRFRAATTPRDRTAPNLTAELGRNCRGDRLSLGVSSKSSYQAGDGPDTRFIPAARVVRRANNLR